MLLIGLSQLVHAQEAIDFQMTDIHGKNWHLFQELEKGKTVVLDFFFAHCKPCQKLTPGMVNLYKDYAEDTSKLIVLGISDRDKDTALLRFESDFLSNYSSAGIEGGGDTITDLYKGYFSFSGWPTYAVICPDRSLHWNLERDSNFLQVRGKIDSCAQTVSIKDKTALSYVLFPNPVRRYLKIKSPSSKAKKIKILSSNGAVLMEFFTLNSFYSLDLIGLANGVYYIQIEEDNKTQISQIYIQN